MDTTEKYVVWPIYFDKNASKKTGRRIPRNIAVKHPKAELIYRAAQKLELNPTKMDKKSHPSRWWDKEGCVLVDKKKSKTETLYDIAQIIYEKNKL